MFRNYALELNGSLVGKLTSASDGSIMGEVSTAPSGFGPGSKKQLDNVTYTPIELTTGLSMGRAFYDWIKQSWNGEAPREDGTVVLYDDKNKELGRQEFMNALLTESVFPALDGASKDPASISLEFQPERTRYKPGGSSALKLGAYATAGAMRWLRSNFRIIIGEFDKACAKISKIGPLSVKMNVATERVGTLRESQLSSRSLEYSNLKITVPVSAADELMDWHKDVVSKGNTSATSEKQGLLEYLTPDEKKTYFTIKLNSLGIIKVDIAPGTKELTAEMYCESFELAYDAATALG